MATPLQETANIMSHGTDSPSGERQIELLLERLDKGDKSAMDVLLPLLSEDLRRLARQQRRLLGSCETLNTTALIHEVYLKFRRHDGVGATSHHHFLHTAALAMRQILIDHARSRIAARRRDGRAADTMDPPDVVYQQAQEVLDVDLALKRLEPDNPRLVDVVNYRYFAGYSERETGNLLGICERTVRRDWLKALAWLGQLLAEPEP